MTGKPGSKWLDRLRLSKGFPAGNDLDLDDFISHHHQKLPSSPGSTLPRADIGPKANLISAKLNEEAVLDRLDEEKALFNVMSNVLSELFNFGETNGFPRMKGKKSSRKQVNPRICVASDSKNAEDKSGSETDLLSLLREEENFDDDEKNNGDFVGFSRTQVTVIDTSYPWWKCEKLLFRKKNIWRVRDRKGRSTKMAMKKRKAKLLENKNAGTKKKLKRACASSNEETKHNGRVSKDPEVTLDTLRHVQKQRLPKKSKKRGTNFLVKGTPTSKKNGLTPIRVAGS